MSISEHHNEVINFSDLTDRIEELESDLEDEANTTYMPDGDTPDEAREELAALVAFVEECKGSGGDHQWRGDWYPGQLIAHWHFKAYAEELADEIGAIKSDAGWPNNHIDWESAADELKHDYSSVEFDGNDYWYR